jgi:hypothetical protein
MHILLTDPRGVKKLINMALVSEALPVINDVPYTNLVVPSATNSDDNLIPVRETPEQIEKIMRMVQAGLRLPAG